MARESFKENIRIVWIPEADVTDYTAMTLAEITGGTDFTSELYDEMPSTPRTVNTITTSDPTSLEETRGLGTRGGDNVSVKVYRDTEAGNNLAVDAHDEGAYGYWVIRYFGANAAIADAEEVDIYPIAVLKNEKIQTGANEPQGSMIEAAVTTVPVKGYTVPAV